MFYKHSLWTCVMFCAYKTMKDVLQQNTTTFISPFLLLLKWPKLRYLTHNHHSSMLLVYFTHIICAYNFMNDGCNWGKMVPIIGSKTTFSSIIYHKTYSLNFISYLIWKSLSHPFLVQTTVISYYMLH